MRCFAAFLKKEARAGALYRTDFLLKLCYGLIAMYGIRCLWAALYAQNPAIVGRDLPSMVTYAMMAVALDMVFYPSAVESAPHLYIAQQIRTGRIDTDLLRPVHFQSQILLRDASATLFGMLGLVLPGWGIAVVFFGMQLPVSAFHALAFLLSCVLSYLILFSLNFLLGMICFLTTDIRNITMAYGGLLGLLSGKLIPIWLYPSWMQAVCEALPFRCIFETPLNIYTGACGRQATLGSVLLQAFWVALLLALGRAAWSRVYRRLSVQGG